MALLNLQEALLLIITFYDEKVTETPGETRSNEMTFKYDETIVTTDSGALDLDYYRIEANRERSEFFRACLKSAFVSTKNFFKAMAKFNGSPIDNFLLQKTVK
jgi:hypothetical protein